MFVGTRFLGPVGLARQIGEFNAGTHYEGRTPVPTKLRIRQEICGAGGATRKKSVQLRRPVRQVRQHN